MIFDRSKRSVYWNFIKQPDRLKGDLFQERRSAPNLFKINSWMIVLNGFILFVPIAYGKLANDCWPEASFRSTLTTATCRCPANPLNLIWLNFFIIHCILYSVYTVYAYIQQTVLKFLKSFQATSSLISDTLKQGSASTLPNQPKLHNL